MQFNEIFTLEPIPNKFQEGEMMGWTTMGFTTFDGHYAFTMNAGATMVRLGYFVYEEKPFYQLVLPDPMQVLGVALLVSKFDPRYKVVTRTPEQIRQDEIRSRTGIIVPARFVLSQ